MQVEIIKRGGAVIDVYFSGDQYVFNDHFAGIFAIASRDFTTPIETPKFELLYGNSHSNAMTLPAVKNYIKKNESKYMEVNPAYNVVETKCNNQFTFTITVNKI